MVEIKNIYAEKHLRFVVIGDSKGKEQGINVKVLCKILHEVKKLNPQPQYLITLGDSVAGSGNCAVTRTQLLRFKEIIFTTCPGIKILPVLGNHEVNNNPCDETAERIFQSVYSELKPDERLTGYNGTVYCIDSGETRLICLSSFHHCELHRIIGEQLQWFKRVAAVPKKHKIVFVHSPAYPTGAHLGSSLDKYPEDRDVFWKVIDENNIDIVFSGHEHNYSRRVVDHRLSSNYANYISKIQQIISGGGGEKLRDSYKSKTGIIVAPKDVNHFVDVDIAGNTINVQAISSAGKSIDKFTILKTTP
jgi:hypothetical protein